MASAKEYAQQQLGNLDLSYLDKEKEVAKNMYDTSSNSLQTSYNSLMDQIGKGRADTRKNFNASRTAISENAFDMNRDSKASLASKGVGVGGLQRLSEVGNRMETGRNYSNVANKFYDGMSELDTTERQGNENYEIDKQKIKNTLDSTMSGIESRGKEAENSYNMTLGQLAEAVQGRWDNNANAKAALAQAERAAAQAHQDALNASANNLRTIKKQSLLETVNSKSMNNDQKVTALSNQFGIDSNTARNLLVQMGVYGSTPMSGYDKNTNYYNQVTGGW